MHTVVTTAPNEADIMKTSALLNGKDKSVFADAGYSGAENREELKDTRRAHGLPPGQPWSPRFGAANETP